MDTCSRWNEDLFTPESSFSFLAEMWGKLDLGEAGIARYYEVMRSWARQRNSLDELRSEVSQFLNKDQLILHDDFVDHIAVFCQLNIYGVENASGQNGMNRISKHYLPHVSDINTRLVLACLHYGIEFPSNSDPALHINSAARTLITNRIEDGLKIIRNFLVSESGMLRFKPLGPGANSTISLEDIADSLTLRSSWESSELLREVRNFESVAKFCESLIVQNKDME